MKQTLTDWVIEIVGYITWNCRCLYDSHGSISVYRIKDSRRLSIYRCSDTWSICSYWLVSFVVRGHMEDGSVKLK
jgi:hypothetical protein